MLLSQGLMCNLTSVGTQKFGKWKRLLLPHFLIFLPGALFPSGYVDEYCYKLEPAGSSVYLEAKQTLVMKLALGQESSCFMLLGI